MYPGEKEEHLIRIMENTQVLTFGRSHQNSYHISVDLLGFERVQIPRQN